VIRDLRREYASRTLDEASTNVDPIAQFRIWFEEVLIAEVLDANAMSLATASKSGEPSVRTVLLKEFDHTGFVFFTHYDSRKGQDLADNPRASLLFFWPAFERQVRVSGAVTTVARAESEAYFASRPLESQLAAWSAVQSTVLPSREALDDQFSATLARFADQPVTCPPRWGGFRVAPERLEFWQGRPSRLHDRLVYTRQADGTWSRVRLAP
jgi:pyridoxamine 5'-phosphate oxidase